MGSVEFDARRYDREQAEGEKLQEQAESERQSLIDDFISDERSKNETTLLDYLGDLAGGDSEFLHCLQRILRSIPHKPNDAVIVEAAIRMARLFRDKIDVGVGDDLVSQRATELGEKE